MQLNKKLMFSLTLLFTMVLFGCSETGNTESSGNENGSQKVIELNLNSAVSSTHYMSVGAIQPWAEMVEEKTNGRVKVNIYHGGALGSPTSVWQDVQGGLYDVGAPLIVPYFYDTELFPLTISALPFAFPDEKSGVSTIMTKFAEKYGEKASEKVVLMGITASDPYDVISTKPIKGFEDMKGLKVRATGKIDGVLIKDWGASPVSLPFQDAYEALDKGTLDATLSSATIMVGGSTLHEVAPNITKLNLSLQLFIPVMNMDFYNKLPSDIQMLFDEELSPKLAELIGESVSNEKEKAYVEAEKVVEGRGEVITLSPEDLEKFKEPAEAQWDSWVEEANGKGYPGEEMMEYFKQLIEEEGLELPF